jgi:hypothetical protein
MDRAERCRAQADECPRLLLLATSGAEATILTSLMRSWKMIANQTDRYVAIMKKDAAQRPRAIANPSRQSARARQRTDGAGAERPIG